VHVSDLLGIVKISRRFPSVLGHYSVATADEQRLDTEVQFEFPYTTAALTDIFYSSRTEASFDLPYSTAALANTCT
jgi:hypothetical protein